MLKLNQRKDKQIKGLKINSEKKGAVDGKYR